MATLDAIRKTCWDRALHCFATARIFEQRANRFHHRLRVLTFLGIAVPITIGAVLTTFGSDSWFSILSQGVSGLLGFIQLIVSIWALVTRWEDQLLYGRESQADNDRLSERYKLLATTMPRTIAEAQRKFGEVEREDQVRTRNDNHHAITVSEKRFGMRHGLRQFQRECVQCTTVPQSLKPSDCDNCGNFNLARF